MRAPVPACVRPVVHMYRHEVPSPVGPFFIYTNAKGEVCCANWTENEQSTLKAITEKHFKSCQVVLHRDTQDADAPGSEAASLLRAYFAFHGEEQNSRTSAAVPDSVFAAFADRRHGAEAASASIPQPVSMKRQREDGTQASITSSVRASLDTRLAQQAAMDALLRRVPIALAPDASAFQRQVWRTLHAKVPSGTITTYQKLGDMSSESKGTKRGTSSARAVGTAMHDNPLCVLVPCHRVLASNMGLNGYGCGLYRKAWLLRHEMAQEVPSEKLRRVETEVRVSTPDSRK